MTAIVLVGVVLLCLGSEWGLLPGVPPLVWFVWMLRRSGRWRIRALDGLEIRAASMTEQERERNLVEIYRIYGGVPLPKLRRRVERIRAIPPRSELK
jgi:hypothetical protein